MSSALRRTLLPLAICCWLMPRGVAHAQDAVQLAVFPAASNDNALNALANALNSALVAELRRLDGVSVAARPALDLPTTQLALGCDDGSDDCLRGATEIAHTQALLAPALKKTEDHRLVVSLLYFNAASAGSRTIERSYAEPAAKTQVLDGIASMVRELFQGAAEPPPAAATPENAGPTGSAQPDLEEVPPLTRKPARKPEAASSFPVLPVVLAATGTALLGTGIAFGVLTNATKREYRSADPHTMAEADALADTLKTGRRQAALCNWGLGLGSAALVAGVTLWIIEDANTHPAADTGSADASATTFVPSISPRSFAVSLHHRW